MKEKLLQVKSIIDELLKEISTKGEDVNINDFDALSSLLNSDDWPEAVFPFQIADDESEKDKDDRAEGIIDILLPPLEGKKFLDYGCGEGHVAFFASKTASLSVGYDIKKSPKDRFTWDNRDGAMFLTSNLENVKAEAPYDVILIYDVLDHAQGCEPQEILARAKSLLSDDGRIFLRTHPWTSRHGGHAYRKINKAFVHLVLNEEELNSLGIKIDFNRKILRPVATYNSWIKETGLKNSKEPELDSQEVEEFFKQNQVVRQRILKSFGISEWGEDPPAWQMSQCFWDYVLEKE